VGPRETQGPSTGARDDRFVSGLHERGRSRLHCCRRCRGSSVSSYFRVNAVRLSRFLSPTFRKGCGKMGHAVAWRGLDGDHPQGLKHGNFGAYQHDLVVPFPTPHPPTILHERGRSRLHLRSFVRLSPRELCG